jgi:hypothetical protein
MLVRSLATRHGISRLRPGADLQRIVNRPYLPFAHFKLMAQKTTSSGTTDQTAAVLSREEVTTRRPSGLKLVCQTSSLCANCCIR